MPDHAPTQPPPRRGLFGVQLSATTYDQVVAFVIATAAARGRATIDLMPVHGLITAARDADFRQRINRFDVVAPDGQPVRWALNWFHGTGLRDRVYGPELMLRVCAAAEAADEGIYLYGSQPDVLDKLQTNLLQRFPRLRIVGAHAPPFRPLTDRECAEALQRIEASGATIVFLGLGCPRQEIFADKHRESIQAVQLCVGAAVDFHAGTKRMAPVWMQRRGLEWLFRLTTEPRRLWRRYLVTNSLFLMLATRHALSRIVRPPAAGVSSDPTGFHDGE